MTPCDHCPPLEVFTAYVAGKLPSAAEPGFEAHVAACSVCAEILEREACLEMTLHEVADRLAPSRSRSWSRRWTNATSHGVGALAAAASVLLTLGLSWPWVHHEAETDRAVSSSPAEGELLACTPSFDDAECVDSSLVAQREPMRVPWTELPETIDPATCWSEDDGDDLVCTPAEASG